MKLLEIKQEKFHLYIILKAMFNMVNADYDLELSNDWYYKYEWTKEQENEFKDWLVEILKDTKIMKELAGHKMVNLAMRTKVANAFILNYGWKVLND